MKTETESRKNALVSRVGELAKVTQELAREAAHQYSAEVEAIVKSQSRDTRHIERCLDGMLDFSFDDEVLALYKKLCRYYFDIDPEATVFYVNAYREMWEEQEPQESLPD
jgi:tRNA A37 N6-isopentenylltransferase MiaA